MMVIVPDQQAYAYCATQQSSLMVSAVQDFVEDKLLFFSQEFEESVAAPMLDLDSLELTP